MARRRILIVDDSKTAQIRLRKMLENFDLEVDTALSAEEALGYLSYRQPSVIFLDHHMEGMDGLEALKIIKSNPGTALIPVIMYTSEQGDVYVGQARALGAIDILSKEVMKHANLEKVLVSLGISAKDLELVGSSTEQPTLTDVVLEEPLIKPPLKSFDEFDLTDSPPPTLESTTSDLEQVQKQVSRLFELHIAKVRQEIEDSTKFLLRRLAKDSIDRNKSHPTPPAPQILPLDPVEPEPEKMRISSIVLGLILIGIAFLGYHLYINNRHQELLNTQYADLVERTRAQEDLINRLFAKVGGMSDSKVGQNNFADRQIFLDALSWAVNLDTQVNFGELALGDQKTYMLGDLLILLKAADFKGTVYLDIHIGNFCVIEDPKGSWMLPEPDSNLDECVFIANRITDVAEKDQVSIGFLNYLQSAPILTEGNIKVELSSQGYASPSVSYPASTSATSAGEWNHAAQKNNRISVSFAAH